MRKYKTEEERRLARDNSRKKWLENNREKRKKWEIEYSRKKYRENKEYFLNKNKESRKRNKMTTRSHRLLENYNASDKKYNRGKGDLTAKWIRDNILPKPCAHCGKTGWDTIGCNRLDNSKPHTMDNVEPCCRSCNCRLAHNKQVYQYTFDGKLVDIYSSTSEAARQNDFYASHIASCCRGERKTHKGFRWSYEPL